MRNLPYRLSRNGSTKHLFRACFQMAHHVAYPRNIKAHEILLSRKCTKTSVVRSSFPLIMVFVIRGQVLPCHSGLVEIFMHTCKPADM